MTPECCQALTLLQRGQNDFQDLLDVGAAWRIPVSYVAAWHAAAVWL